MTNRLYVFSPYAGDEVSTSPSVVLNSFRVHSSVGVLFMKPYRKANRVYDLAWIKSNVTIDNNGCWNWNKALQNAGYGTFGILINGKNKTHTTHRYVYQIVHRKKLKRSVLVRHKCHNRRCCNPKHLEEGSYLDNWYDSESTHRQAFANKRALKQKAKNATLKDSKVTTYRRLYLERKMTLRGIAKETGLARATVFSFLIGKTYRRRSGYVAEIRKWKGLPPLS